MRAAKISLGHGSFDSATIGAMIVANLETTLQIPKAVPAKMGGKATALAR